MNAPHCAFCNQRIRFEVVAPDGTVVGGTCALHLGDVLRSANDDEGERQWVVRWAA